MVISSKPNLEVTQLLRVLEIFHAIDVKVFSRLISE
jgi:hypothetical protein